MHDLAWFIFARFLVNCLISHLRSFTDAIWTLWRLSSITIVINIIINTIITIIIIIMVNFLLSSSILPPPPSLLSLSSSSSSSFLSYLLLHVSLSFIATVIVIFISIIIFLVIVIITLSLSSLLPHRPFKWKTLIVIGWNYKYNIIILIKNDLSDLFSQCTGACANRTSNHPRWGLIYCD